VAGTTETALGRLWGDGLVPGEDWKRPGAPPYGVAVLGATGSVGAQTLDVIAAHPGHLRAVALAAATQGEALVRQAEAYGVRRLGLARAEGDLSEGAQNFVWTRGDEALMAVATAPEVDVVVAATPGLAALRAVLAALRLGRIVALANKEILVAGGDLIARAVREGGGALVPVDSEHVAVHQCLRQELPSDVRRVVLTASGGPFRAMPSEELDRVTPEAALRHPNWSMGPMNTLNSATLMNKGLEVLEAQRLFGLGSERVAVVVHPESLVHSFVEMRDGTVMAQMASADMRLPIQYALLYPGREPSLAAPLDLLGASRLTFEPVRRADFPSLSLAEAAGKIGGTAPAVLVAANEEAVAAFVAGSLGFPGIPRVVEEVLQRADVKAVTAVEDIEQADVWARQEARTVMRTRGG
jgi:1-deoxy-D-xylulose-5-phosphate reductoisomerase